MSCPRCALTHGDECPPIDLVSTARTYIGKSEFTFAKTMPKNPHWYVVRERAQKAGDGDGHEALYELIRDYHYLRYWHRQPFRSMDIDGFSYWIMEDGTIINRKPVGEAGWDG